ncbi:MAG: hypothetical protein KC619_16620 [Myxococcales bacterium]|nr:hypothetical protein [Myxococcales bacterium]
MTETSTANRVALEVPSPWTLLTIGERYDSSASDYSGVNYSGVCVNTDSHVRMYAMGDASASDLVGQASGRVWLQAKQDLAMLADKTLVVGSYKDTYLAAAGGITVMAGYATANAVSEASPGTLPNAIESYDAKASLASGIWTGFDVAMGIVTGVVAGVQAILLGKFSWLAAQKAVINTVGTALNIAGLGWSKDVSLPGLNLFSEGGTFISSFYGSVNVIGLAGLLMGSLFHYEIAWNVAKARGFKRVSLSATNNVDLTAAFWFEAKTDGDHTYAARAGAMNVRGVKLKVGQGRTKYPQSPTLTQTYYGVLDSTWKSLLAITVKVLKDLEATATTNTTIDAVDAATFKAGVFTMTVKNAQVVLGDPVTGGVLKAAPSGLTLLGPGLLGSIKLKPTEMAIEAGAGSLRIKPGAAIAIDGLELKVG